MSDPLSALGLAPGADERAVKRAYARLLRDARPDVDPAGFQALREAYEGALALVRAGGGGAQPAEGGAVPAGDAVPPPSGAAPPAPEVPRFTIDLGLLVPALLARAAEGTAEELRAWIAEGTADWPIAARPAVAPHLLESLAEDGVDLTPEQFDVIAEGFGLDDVALGLDPTLVPATRARLAARDAERRRAAEVAARLRPENRQALCRHMGTRENGGYDSVDVRAMAALLTGRGALARARALQFVPLLAGGVWHFIAHIDGGRTDALSPAIRPEVVEVWRRADRRRAAFRPYRGWALLTVVAAVILAAVALDPSSGVSPFRPSGPQDAASIVRAGDRAFDAGDYGSALDAYEGAIARAADEQPPPPGAVVASAYYDKGIALEKLGRSEEARQAYDDLDAAFIPLRPTDPDVRLLLARGLNNAAALAFTAGSFTRAWEDYAAVVSRYGRAGSADMEAQVLMALAGEARSLARQGRAADAAEACAAARARVAPSTRVEVRLDVEGFCGSAPR